MFCKTIKWGVWVCKKFSKVKYLKNQKEIEINIKKTKKTNGDLNRMEGDIVNNSQNNFSRNLKTLPSKHLNVVSTFLLG